MTVLSENKRNQYSCNGVLTEFPYTFRILDEEHIQVLLRDSVGEETILILNSTYTVTGVGNSEGGNIITDETYSSDYTLTLIRDVTLTQETDYIANDMFPAESHERGLDKLTMSMQQLYDEIHYRALLLGKKSNPSELSMPDPIAKKYLQWKEDLTGLTNVDLKSSGDLSVSAFVETLLNDENSREFMSTLMTGGYFPNYAEVDQGVTGNGKTINAFVEAIGTTDQATIALLHNSNFPFTTYVLSTNETIPPNIHFVMEKGAVISIDGGVTLTLPPSFNPGLYKVFTGAGDVAGLKKSYPEWYGAVGDNATDDSAALNKVFDNAEERSTVYLTSRLGYGTASAVTCKHHVNIEMLSPITYTGSSDITVLAIGTNGTANRMVRLKLQVVRADHSDWLSEDNIGVKLINIYLSEIKLDYIDGFTRNAVLYSHTAGVAYNTFHLNHIINGKYGIDLYAATEGWVNENTFLGGRVGVDSTVNNTLDRFGIRFTSQDDAYNGYYYNNANTFFKLCFEMGKAAATGDAVGVLMEYGQLNTFHDCRDENNDEVARITNDSRYNLFDFSYGLGALTDNSDHKSNYSTHHNQYPYEPYVGSSVFHSGALHKKACYADGDTYVHVPRVVLGTSSNANIAKSLNNITMGASYLTFGSTRSLGKFIDTRTSKRFIARKDVEVGYGGRMGIQAYDSGGSILTDGGANHPYVFSQTPGEYSYGASHGGIYLSGSDSDADRPFGVHDDVKYVKMVMVGGTAELRIRSFTIFSVDGGAPATWTGYEEVMEGSNIGTAAPTAGTWERGRVVYNAAPTAGNYMGWVCTTAGTPGTWKNFGPIAD